ncbi:hypothetical protein G7Y89_g13923 [Cudoniella acicularis]|uniref:alpha-1,2-Mannosidase n=1 Tax=Cudoniella acicularis TaxID=354080 RepID=A0A8H4R8R6_9HELO|nr:hypothetical protein G7Y89_g13923 [Cudoniella acicularis]
MYEYALAVMKRNIFYRPMTRNNTDVRLAGNLGSNGKTLVGELETKAKAQYFSCFAGSIVSIASKIFENEEDLVLGRKFVEGRLWAYEIMPLGIMPETMYMVIYKKKWREKVDKAIKGSETVDDTRYILRLEAIESVFILYRITGNPSLRDRA